MISLKLTHKRNKLKLKTSLISCYVFAVQARALVPAELTLLEAFAVVFQAAWFWAFTAFVLVKILHIIPWLLIHAFCTLTIHSTELSMREAITILGIALGFGAPAFELLFGFDEIRVDRQKIENFPFLYLDKK